ncbi:MAG: penicillin-binding protein activator [Alphaproteobacteria bacterium]
MPSTRPPSPGLSTGPQMSQPGQLQPGQTVKVALILPLTGDYAEVGQAMQRAAEIALFDVGDKRVQLVPLDDKGTPEGAADAANQAIAQNVNLILGPLLAGSVRAVRDRAATASINVVAFSTDATVAGGNVYLLSFLPEQQVARIMAQAAQQNLKRIAVLAPQTPYGTQVVKHVQDLAPRFTMSVARVAYYDVNAKDYSKEIRAFADYDRRHGAALAARSRAQSQANDEASRRAAQRMKRVDAIGELDFDAVLIPEGGQRLQLVASLLNFYEVDPGKIRYLGMGQWDDPALKREPSVKGAWFAAPPPEARSRFVEKYRAAHKTEPPRIATLAYDAVALAAVLARNPNGPDFSAAALTNERGFSGLDGIFRFRTDGLSERGLAVLQIERDDFKVISPAPTTFDMPIN